MSALGSKAKTQYKSEQANYRELTLTDNPVGTRRFLFLETTPPPLDSHDDELGVECGVERVRGELSLAVFTATPSSNQFSRRLVMIDSVPCILLSSDDIDDCISDNNVWKSTVGFGEE